MILLTRAESNTKTAKNDTVHFLSTILHLAPSDTGQTGINVCPSASPGCKWSCLNTAGRGRFDKTQRARINRTKLFAHSSEIFFSLLYEELAAFVRRANRLGVQPVARLNGTSDIAWEDETYHGASVFDAFPEIIFYDYTKRPGRMRKFLQKKLPVNYFLTFSASETNWKVCESILEHGGHVAVVFDRVPESYLGYSVINGDLTDLRFMDYREHGFKPLIIGLKAKGRAKQDRTGFVKRVPPSFPSTSPTVQQ